MSNPTNKQLRAQIVNLARGGAPAEPRCRHAPPVGECGGCAFQAVAYADQVRAKHSALRDLWTALLPANELPQIGFVASPDPYHYRTRMDYVASKQRFGLRRGGKFNYIVDLHECQLIPPTGFAAARAVYEHAMALGLPDYNLRSHEGFLRYVVVRRSPDDQLLVAVVTAAPDPEGARAAAVNQLAATALSQPGVLGFHWLVNSSRTDLSFGAPQQVWGAEFLPMRVGARTLLIGPNTFFQNNTHLILSLLDDVKAAVETPRPGVSTAARRDAPVADLYGGVGTIALHLADVVGQIVCVEAVEESAALARRNAAANRCDNVEALAADTLDFLREQPTGRFEVVVVDPPRTGLGPEVCRELLRISPHRLVYVSCNPLTQIDDARILAQGYRLAQLSGYDMFPQTPHMEALGVFERRTGS